MNVKESIARLESYGARVGVFGRDVYVTVPTHADLLVLAVFYRVDIRVVISRHGRQTAADAIEYEAGGYRWHVQGPTRDPSTLDRERVREQEDNDACAAVLP